MLWGHTIGGYQPDARLALAATASDTSTVAALAAHHIKPLHKGRVPYDLDNQQTLCRFCHIDRHRRKPSPAVAAWHALVDEMMPST